VQDSEGGLLEALGEQLQRISGVAVPVDLWRPELLPQHLFACFELYDEHARLIGSGRDLEALQARFGARAQQRFAGVVDAGYERDNIQDWDFGPLPAFVELQQAGVGLRGYPALTVSGERIQLRMFDDPQQALRSHREGLLALFRSKAGRAIREIRRAVPELQKQMLWFSSIASGAVLQADLERAVLQAAFVPDAAQVRDEESFRRNLASGMPRLVGLATDMGRWSFEALQCWHDLNRVLKGALSPQMIAAAREVREQVGGLIYPGFVAATPLRRLPHLARYVRAAQLRLEKLPGNLQRERKNATLVARYQQLYRQAAAAHPQPAGLAELRWMIEELRVSLFAQELGTAEKVSAERLDRLWAELSGD
jgi:ATP-dependent helicase HrpA